MATPLQIQRAQEKARKKQVDDYKKYIKAMEEESKAFYDNELKRENISNKEYAEALKKRAERYNQYSKEVLTLSYMTEEEKLSLSREYMLKSEEALTQHMMRMREIARDDLDSSMNLSSQYVSDRNYYSSWEEVGDDPISAFERVDRRLSEAVLQGTITYEEYYDRLKEFGTQMYNDRIANSNRWLSHESEMNRISSEEYIEGLYRMQTYTREYFSAGIISHREYIDSMQSLEERIFNKKKDMHKEILMQAEEEKRAVDEVAKEKIAALEKEYNAKISAMDKEDRQEELSKLKAEENVYKNSQTREGKERLQDIRERIADIKDDERRQALKENLASSKERVLSVAESRKERIDRNAQKSAYDLGLYYDEQTGYKMISNVSSAFNGVLSEQKAFSQKSFSEIDRFNTTVADLMSESTELITSNILTNFSAFASGVEAIKNKIFDDVRAVNSLDFSRFGSRSGPIKTSVTYNDYGDKNISTTKAADSFFGNLSNLIAKGVRV